MKSSRRLCVVVAVAGALAATSSTELLGQRETRQARQVTVVQDMSTASVAERLTEELRSIYGERAIEQLKSARDRNQVIDVLKGLSRSELAKKLVEGVRKTRSPEPKLVLQTPPVGIDPCWLVCLNCIGVHCEPPPGCSSLTTP